MSDEPGTRASHIRNLLDWIVEVHPVWRLLMVLTLGAAVLMGTLLWRHPEWITMVLQARLQGRE